MYIAIIWLLYSLHHLITIHCMLSSLFGSNFAVVVELRGCSPFLPPSLCMQASQCISRTSQLASYLQHKILKSYHRILIKLTSFERDYNLSEEAMVWWVQHFSSDGNQYIRAMQSASGQLQVGLFLKYRGEMFLTISVVIDVSILFCSLRCMSSPTAHTVKQHTKCVIMSLALNCYYDKRCVVSTTKPTSSTLAMQVLCVVTFCDLAT